MNIGGKLVSIMTFADDLVLIAEDPGDMKILLKTCEKFSDQKGLSVNATKCANLKVLPVKGKKSMKVVTKGHQHWRGQAMPSINFEKLGKYLGLQTDHTEKVNLPRNLWKLYLERIRSSCLTFFQNIRVIKEVMSSKILFQLRLSDHGSEEARKLDRIIRAKVKEILHLPSWTSTDWIRSKEGLGLIELQSTVMLARKRASEKMLKSDDSLAQAVAVEIDPVNGDCLERLRLHNINTSQRKTEWANRRLNRLQKINNGRAITTMTKSKHTRDWLWSDRGLKTRNKV